MAVVIKHTYTTTTFFADPALSVPDTPSAGDVMVLLSVNSAASAATAVSGLGATWSRISGALGVNNVVEAWIGVGATSSGTVTMTASAAGAGRGLSLHMVSGVSSSAVGVTANGAGTQTTPSQLAGDGQVVFGYSYGDDAASTVTDQTPATGWTEQPMALSSGVYMNTLYRVPTGTQVSHTFSALRPSGNAYIGQVVVGSYSAPPPPPPAPLRTNLIPDPGNEAATTKWVAPGGVTASHSTLFAMSGTQSLRLLMTGSGGMPAYFGVNTAGNPNADSIPVTAGEQYTFSAYLRHDNAAVNAQLVIYWMTDTAYQAFSAGALANTTTTFTRYTVTGTVPAGATKMGVNFSANAGVTGSSVFLDNMLLEKASSALPYFDGSTTGGGLYRSWTGAPNASTSTETNVPPGATVLLSDNFDRANSATTVGSPQIGPAPVIQIGVGGITSNQLYCVTTPLVATYDLGTTNVELSFTLTTASGGASAVFGYAAATDYYYVFFLTTAVQLIQVPASQSGVVLYSSTAKLPAASGSVCKAHYRDGIIRAYVDGVLAFRWKLDVPITATKHGVRINNTTARMDNLLGTDAPVIAEDVLPGNVNAPGTFVLPAGYNAPASAYLGRDTKTQDSMAGA